MKLFKQLARFLQKQKSRQALKALPEHLWQDIGKTREEVEQEIAKLSLTHSALNTLNKATKSKTKQSNTAKKVSI